jgi:quinol monooxygenase YgiN
MAEHAHVIRVARFQPAAGKRDELVNRLVSGAEDIRKMEGCFGAQICSVRESPGVIAAVSRWASGAALDQFLQSSIAQRAEVAALTAAPPTTETFDTLGG